MSNPLLPLCSLPKVAMRDGYTGQYANIPLPNYTYGLWFASGAQYTFPSATLAQNGAPFSGTAMPNTFQKDCCSCMGS